MNDYLSAPRIIINLLIMRQGCIDMYDQFNKATCYTTTDNGTALNIFGDIAGIETPRVTSHIHFEKFTIASILLTIPNTF